MSRIVLSIAMIGTLFFGMSVSKGVAVDKVMICHNNLDDPTEPAQVTIEVAPSAVDSHVANHGDTIGACVAP